MTVTYSSGGYESCVFGEIEFISDGSRMVLLVKAAWESDKAWDEFAIQLPWVFSRWQQALVRNALMRCERRHFDHLVRLVENGSLLAEGRPLVVRASDGAAGQQ
jgi:hypothetical protein